jgi:hypothetical protein
MPNRWKAVLVAGAALALMAAAMPAMAGIPDVTNSFYVPQSQASATATVAEGTLATRFFRSCPNNDGGASLPQNARIKVVVRDASNNPIPNIAAADICVLFNGGTAAQGFSGVGADSIISNSTWNPTCPDVRCVAADAPTDATGTTYITFAGADQANPGFAVRNGNRKWGHYDTALPVYVLGFQLSGRLTTGSANGTYSLRIKSFDWSGGLGAVLNQGEAVSSVDFNGIVLGLNVNNAISYWKDFDSNGAVTSTDFNTIIAHLNHNCAAPNNP